MWNEKLKWTRLENAIFECLVSCVYTNSALPLLCNLTNRFLPLMFKNLGIHFQLWLNISNFDFYRKIAKVRVFYL